MKTAIIMLACNDYEAIELSLACHGKFMPADTLFFILQNCRGTYDSERTLLAARRFQQQYPKNVIVIDHLKPGKPYFSILNLLKEPMLEDVEYICKVDDDVFPITPNWLDKLRDVYISFAVNGKIAYSTPIINNNTWGFSEIVDIMNMKEEYDSLIGIEHRVGSGNLDSPYKIIKKDEIITGSHGTIWGNPHIARWIHSKTTMQPQLYINATQGLSEKCIPYQDRYSIGCIFFKKDFWENIYNGGNDDEHMIHQYCKINKVNIVCTRSVPFVHLAYYSQREENRDIIQDIKQIYNGWLNLPWPIGIHATRESEIEGRLRWLENKMLSKDGLLNNNSFIYKKLKNFFPKKLKNYLKSLFYIIKFKYSIKRK